MIRMEMGGKMALRSMRRRIMGGLAALLLGITAMLGGWTQQASAAQEVQQPRASGPSPAEIDDVLQSLQALHARAETLSDWVALALARGGKPATSRYAAVIEQTAVPENFRRVTDYARMALAVSAHGWDARKVGPGKIDLLAQIARSENMTAQGPNGPAYALLALDAGGYASGPQDRWTRSALIRWLLDQRGEAGGWSLAAGQSEVDVTGIVLTALAPYQDLPDVRAAIDGALAWLSSVQNEHGGFGSYGMPETSESAVQVIIALTALGIDPASDERFIKNGRSVLERLLSFRQPDGSFAHVPGGKPDALATMYALLGMTAVDLFQDGLPGLFSGVPAGQATQVSVYGPTGTLAQASVPGRTALEALVQVLRQKNLSYVIGRHPQQGVQVTAIGEYGNGHFGGNDKWQYAVRKDGQWVRNLTGLGDYELNQADELVVYYGDSPALIHDVKFEPSAPREGWPLTITVKQETYDVAGGKVLIGPAAGARVSIGGVSAVTDRQGKAELTGLKAGQTVLRIDGYKQGAAPAFVTFELPVAVQSHVKNVSVRVEGDEGLIIQGPARGGTAKEALEHLLHSGGVPYELQEMSFGTYISSINGIEGGKYGGFDGWLFAILNEDGSWTYPSEGIGTFLLEEGMQVVVYYGDNTLLPEPILVTPSRAKPGEPVTVTVRHREMNWETGKLGAAKPLAGATVSAGGATAVTDANGRAQLGGLAEGLHEVIVSGYGRDRAPTVLRTVGQVSVAGAYADQAQIAPWAADWVHDARASGILLGEDDRAGEAAFRPKEGISRGAFVAALVRAMGIKPVQPGETFRDVPDVAWYAGEIEAAAQAGLIAGVAPGQFAPEAGLTREQAAVLLARALGIQAAANPQAFADEQQVSAYARNAVQAVLEQGWMTLQQDGTFLPKMTVTREQTAVIAVRILQAFRHQ